MAGMWSESTTARPALNAIWNWESKKRNTAGERAAPAAPKGRSEKGIFSVHKKFKNYYKEITEKLLQIGFKRVTIWLQQGHKPSWVWNLFLLVLGISGTGSPPPTVLLHSSWAMCRTGGIPLRVQKSSSVLDELFCILCTLKMTSRAGKYDLTSFWWSICLFFRKGHLQSLARQGFVFWLSLW